MEKLRLRDLKPFIEITKSDNYYHIIFRGLIPILKDNNILVPLSMLHEVDVKYVVGKRKLFYQRMILMLAQEINKIVIMYEPIRNKNYIDSYGEKITDIYKDDILYKWRKKVISVRTLRKIVYEYLGR